MFFNVTAIARATAFIFHVEKFAGHLMVTGARSPAPIFFFRLASDVAGKLHTEYAAMCLLMIHSLVNRRTVKYHF